MHRSNKLGLVAAALVALVLTAGAAFAKDTPLNAKGTIVDVMCGADMTSQADADAHTKKCALSARCVTSGFGAVIDGKFHKFSVKVEKAGFGYDVRYRKGYFALRTTSGTPTLNYEAPALAILEQSPPPNAFPVRAMALRFPEDKRLDLVPVLVNVPIGNMTFRESNDKKSVGSDFTVLVRFRDDTGNVVEKVSQHYQLSAPIEQAERAKNGEALFYREPVLFPGVFTMETVVYDAFASKASGAESCAVQFNQPKSASPSAYVS